jgi:hypothetical protein
MTAKRWKSRSNKKKRGMVLGRPFIRPEERPDLTTAALKKSGK